MIIIICVILILIILIVIIPYINRHRGLTKYKQHIIADAPHKNISVKLLKEIKRRLKLLVFYCYLKYPTHPNVKLLKKRFNPDNIQESSLYEQATSYTIDKGEELHLCLRDKTHQKYKHHKINVLIFVSIHELAHIMSTSFGHNTEFSNNFMFLLEKGIECGIYKYHNYKKKPKNFCGIIIDNTPL
jgi:hypothetical protein